MRRILLGTLFPVTMLASTSSARTVAEDDLGPMVYNPQCFVEEVEEERSQYAPPPPMNLPQSTSGAVHRPTPSRKLESRQGFGGSGKGRPSAPAAESIAMPDPAPMPAEPPVVGYLDDEMDGRDMDMGDVARRPSGPRTDWGGTVYLSNDDSMSLASAQHVLFAAQNGRSVPADQIRPHELLNYFSFEAPEPSGGDSFSVAVSSTRTDDDQMSVAFAVRGSSPKADPLDLTLVVDRSGSMQSNQRMELTKRAMRTMTKQLSRGDRVDLVLFDDVVCNPIENFVVGRDSMSLLTETIARIQPRGSTDLDSGLREGYRLTRNHAGNHRNKRVMVVTDAHLNTGNVNPALVSEVGRAFDQDRIRLTGVGVGQDFNDDMLDKLTEKGKGAYVFLGSDAVVDRMFGSGFPSLVETIAHDVHFKVELPKSLAMERFYGEEMSSDKADVQAIHFSAGTSQVFLQDLTVNPGALRSSDKLTFTATYEDARTGEPRSEVFHTTVGAMSESNTANVHKARALMAWSDVLLTKSMTGRCGDLSTYRGLSLQSDGDAEIAYVNGLVERACGVEMVSIALPETPSKRVDYKVKVDSDIAIGSVALACNGQTWTEQLSASDTVARFSATPGSCRISLDGIVPMTANVEVPEVGGDLRCLVRGGRVNCS
jgi:Ca-activated chloride channel homolog